MVRYGEVSCPKCGGQLKYYDSVQRTVLTKYRKKNRTYIRRFQCCSCKCIHREIPDYICPYHQYESEIIFGALEGLITSETLGFEDYPCEATIKKWFSQKMQLLLWR